MCGGGVLLNDLCFHRPGSLSPRGTVGCLGNLSQQLLFFDPRTLTELARFSTLRFRAPALFYESQTHVVWLDEDHFVTAIGPELWRFSLGEADRRGAPRRASATLSRHD